MSNLIEAHKDRLGYSVMVFGLAGLAFYAVMLIANFVLKYGAQLLIIVKGFGL